MRTKNRSGTLREQRRDGRTVRIRRVVWERPAEPRAVKDTFCPKFFCDHHAAVVFRLNGPWE